MDGIATEVACRAGTHARVTSVPTGYRVTWPGVTVHLDPETKRATIHRQSGRADVSLRRLSVGSAATAILTHCKENRHDHQPDQHPRAHLPDRRGRG